MEFNWDSIESDSELERGKSIWAFVSSTWQLATWRWHCDFYILKNETLNGIVMFRRKDILVREQKSSLDSVVGISLKIGILGIFYRNR